MACLDGVACFVDEKLHLIEFLKQIVWKLNVGLVDLINQQDDFFASFKGFPKFAFLNVVGHVMDFVLAQLAVAQAADRVIFIQPLLGAGCGFDVPFDQSHTKAARNLLGQLGFASAGFAFDQKGAFQCDGRIYGNCQVVGCDVGICALEFHVSSPCCAVVFITVLLPKL